MAPQSRGPQRPGGFAQSKSTPNLTTIRTLAQDRSRTSLDRDAEIYRLNSPYLTPGSGDFSSDDEDDGDVSTEDDEEGGDDGEFPSLNDSTSRSELYTTRSHPHLPPSASQLFPPFYNRPPTPLPPSPSLTSLLRPSFSTHTSHHTTPDSSDTESGSATFPALHTGTTSKAASTVGGGRIRGSAHPKVPTYEYYGFALYLASSLFFLMYTLWAYLPSPFLHQLGIYYYPNRWWALAIPCWLVVLVLWIYAALQSYNTGTLTLGMGSIECIIDEAGKVAILDSQGNIIRERGSSRFAASGTKERGGGGGNRGGRKGIRKMRSRQGSLEKEQKRGYVPADLGNNVPWRELWNEGTDAVMDVPLGGVCEILYGEGRVLEEEEPDEIEI